MARQTAEQKKRSEAAKKAAATRKANQEADQSGDEPKNVEETRLATPEELEQQEHDLRVEHNARTGGGEIHEGELQAQRDEHNRRTSGATS